MSALFNLFYIYDPWLLHVFRMGFLVGTLAFVWLAYKIYNKQLVRGIMLPLDSLAVLVALIVLSVIPLLINGSRDFSVILMYCKALLLFILGIAIYNLFYRTENGRQQLVQDIQTGIIIQAAFGFLALCGITFIIEVVLSTHVVLPRFYGSEQEYRLYNITSSAFFQLSLFYVVLLHFLLAYNAKENNIPSIYLLLLLFIGVISGRTFFMFSALSILLYFKLRYIPVLLIFAAIVLFLAKFYPTNLYVAHALEPVINLMQGSEQLSSSTDTLITQHLFTPQTKQLIMGDGRYFTPEGRYYGGSDSGFVRQALYGGVLYLLACFLFTWYFVQRVSLNWFNNSWKFTYSLLLILTALNVKADTYAFPGLMLIFLMFLSLFGKGGKNLLLFAKEA